MCIGAKRQLMLECVSPSTKLSAFTLQQGKRIKKIAIIQYCLFKKESSQITKCSTFIHQKHKFPEINNNIRKI